MSIEAGKVTPKYEVQNVRIVLDILQGLSASPDGERLSPFVKKLRGVSKNRLFRMLSTLEAEAFVVKNDEGTYCLGPAAYGLAKEILVDQDCLTKVRPLMHSLGVVTGETVYLGRVENGEALLIDYRESEQKVRAIRCLGRCFPVDCGEMIDETECCQVFMAEDSLAAEVTTVSLIFKNYFGEQPLALVVVAPSCRMTAERIRSELLPQLLEQTQKFA